MLSSQSMPRQVQESSASACVFKKYRSLRS
jgi:hypothetical protein